MDFDQIVVKESPGLCRCCLSEGCYKDLGTEYPWMEDTEIYADMLLECFDISISQHNEGPNGPKRLICEVCITRLRDACNFKKQVLDSEKKFVDMVGRGDFRTKAAPILYEEQMKSEISMEAVDMDDVEYLNEDDHFDDDSFKDEATSTRTDVLDTTVKKRGRPKKAAVKPEKKNKVAKVEEKPRTSKVSKDKNTRTHQDANRQRRQNLQVLFNNTTVIPFKGRGSFKCFYCGKTVVDYQEFRRHTKTHNPCSIKDRAIKLVKTDDAEVRVDVSVLMCELCEKTKSNFDELITHLIDEHSLMYDKDVKLVIMKYELENFKCVLCDLKCSSLISLLTHVSKDHELIKPYSCSECRQKFNKKWELETHSRAYHKKEYNCSKCSLRFPSYIALQSHKSNSHVATCNICFKPFATAKKRLEHLKLEHGDDGLTCGFCDKVISTKIGFLRHASKCTEKEEKHSPEELKELIGDGIAIKKASVKTIRNNIACLLNNSTAVPFKFFMNRFRCFYCPKDFNECDDLKEHTKIEHPLCDTTFKCMSMRNRQDAKIKIDVSSLFCKLCFEAMKDLETLIDHLISEHKSHFDKSVDSNIQTFSLIKDRFLCPFCGEEFRYFSNVLKHIGRAHSNNNTVCMHCGATFRNSPNLRAHIYKHHKAAKYKCGKCKIEFSCKKYFQTHLGRVHGNKMVECDTCREKFSSVYEKQRHMINVHQSGHKCSYCGKLFTRNSIMVDHVRRTHLKEKNVQCEICCELFFDVHLLRMHMVKHYGERNFHCDLCGKKFLWKKNLRGHMASHFKNVN